MVILAKTACKVAKRAKKTVCTQNGQHDLPSITRRREAAIGCPVHSAEKLSYTERKAQKLEAVLSTSCKRVDLKDIRSTNKEEEC